MASFNGNIGTPSGGFNLQVSYSISQSISGNYSDVTATGSVKRNNSSYRPYNSSSSSSLVINGTSKGYSGSYDLRSDGYKTIVSNTVRVYHNADGKKSITISFSFNGLLSSYYPNGSISQSITLPAIPRQANITSAPDFNDEQNPTITYSNSAGNTVSSLQACISLDGSADNIGYRDISKTGTSYTFELTEAERNVLRQATTGSSRTIKFFVRTVLSGNTYYSILSKTFSIVNANPIFENFSFEDTNPITLTLTGDDQNIIKGYSNVRVNISSTEKAEALKYASMNKYRFNVGNDSTDITYSSDSSVSGVLNNVSGGVLNVYAIDSRNNSTLVTKNAAVIYDYNPLQKGNINVYRTNGVSEDVTLQLDGNVDLEDFGLIINAIKESKYRYKTTDSSTWSEYKDITLTVSSSGKFTYDDLIEGDITGAGFDIANSYDIEVVISDELSTITYTATLGSGVPNIALAKNGVGIMGKYDEDLGGELQIKGVPIMETGSNSDGHWIKYANGIMICYGTKIFTGLNITNAWGSMFETSINLGDFPQEFIEPPDVINVSCRTAGKTVFIEAVNPTKSSIGSSWLMRPVSDTNVTTGIDFKAIGWWK